MRLHRQEVMQRRQALLAKIAGQRQDLADAAQRWQPALALADQTVAVVHFVRRNALVVGGLAALALVRRNGVAVLVKGGWRAWKAYRYLSTLSNKIIASR